jgi:hypothetical protein
MPNGQCAPALLASVVLAACGSGSGTRADPTPLACAGKAAPGIAPTRLLVGLAGEDASAAKPGFDLRYQYLAGPLAPRADCYDPARTNAVGCGTAWWGTWQWDQDPPGQFVKGFVKRAEDAGLLPMFTYYVILPASGVAEGTPEVTQAATDGAFMARYLEDFRFFLQQIGTHRAVVHVEPDFWGYAQQAARAAGTGATGLPAAVASADPACGAFPDTIAGLGACFVHLVHALAPSAKVALHASPWGSGFDMGSNRNASVGGAAEGDKVGAFLAACGAEADLVVADLADRDAAFYQIVVGQDRWLDATDAALPSFAQLFAWSKGVADRTGKPILWWQIPLGNMSLANTDNHWKDNRLDYFFDHPERVAAGGAIGMAFGAGEGRQTTPETDGGHLFARAAALEARGGMPLCP